MFASLQTNFVADTELQQAVKQLRFESEMNIFALTQKVVRQQGLLNTVVQQNSLRGFCPQDNVKWLKLKPLEPKQLHLAEAEQLTA